MEAEITVIKRDGNRVPYEGIRIVNAVSKAANACGIRDLNLGANGYKVFQGRMPRTIDGCSVLTVIAFSTQGEVVGRGKVPLP